MYNTGVGESEKRLALNEVMFREINERLESRIETLSQGEPQLTVLCECSDPDCTTRLSVTTGEYETVRSDPRQFVVVPGHESERVERIVERTDRYEIVRKAGLAGEIAELTSGDPPS